MSMTVAELVVRYSADTSAALKGAEEVDRKVEGNKQTLAGFAAATRGPMLAASAAVGAFGAKAISMASDLAESQSKVDVVFGSSAEAISRWARTSTTSLLMTEQKALEAAGTFGNLFVALKLPQEEAGKMSRSIVELSADLASFNNVPVEDALLALRSGLVGETEPLRRFGVNLNQATIEAKALELGLMRQGDTITAAGKAQASYALIMEQTATAQGDVARTADGVANRTRLAKAEFGNAAAELGTKLLPIMADLLGSLTGLVQAFSGMPEPAQKAVLAIGGLVLVAGPLNATIGIIAKMRAAMIALAVQSKVTSTVVLTEFGKIEVGAVGAGSAIKSGLMKGMAAVGVAVAGWQIGESIRKKLVDPWFDASNAAIEFETDLSNLGQSFATFVRNQEVGGDAIKQWMTTIGELERTHALTSEGIDRLRQNWGLLQRVALSGGDVAGAIKAIAAGGQDLDGLKKSFEGVRVSAEGTVIALGELSKMSVEDFAAWKEKTIGAFSTVQATLDTLAQQSGLRAKDIITAFEDQVRAVQNFGTNWKKVLERDIPPAAEGFLKNLQQMGVGAAPIVNALAEANNKEFARIIAVWTGWQTEIANTSNLIDGVIAKVNAIPGGNGGGQDRFGRRFNMMAEGGIVNRPTFAMIGEAGPEMVIPLPKLGQTAAAMGATSGSTSTSITIHVAGSVVTERDLLNSIHEGLLQRQSQSGSLGLQ